MECNRSGLIPLKWPKKQAAFGIFDIFHKQYIFCKICGVCKKIAEYVNMQQKNAQNLRIIKCTKIADYRYAVYVKNVKNM